MKVNVEKQENNIVNVNIEVEAEVATAEYNKACRKISERVTIPGFRRGKAPRNMVEKYVGVEKIQKEALDRLLPNVFADTISEHQLDLASEPMIEDFNFTVGEPLTVSAKIEIKPEIVLKDYKGQVIEVEQFQQGEEALERELNAIRERFSTLESVVGRAVNDTDLVVIDFAGTIEGEVIKGGTAKNYQLDIANSSFIPGFAEQIVNKNIGEEFTIDVNFPEEYHDSTIAGKPAQFVIKVNEIKEKKVPEANDELAQKVGPFKTVDELKMDIQSYLTKNVETENKFRAEKAILDKVLENIDVELPDSMINREAKLLLEDVQQKFKSQGISWEQVLETQGHEAMWNNLREEASKRVKTSLVLGAVAKAENITIDDEELLEKVREIAVMYNTDEKNLLSQMSKNSNLVQSLTHQIMGQKILKFLLDNNEVKYIESQNSQEQ
ncbi:MAG: trigger factor [bacterium]